VKPLVCNYFLTFRCNDTCEFCGLWQRPELESVEEAGIEDVKKNLSDLKKAGVLVMNFTGGEPLLRDDIQEILRASKRHGFFNILTTNAIEYPAKAERITGLVDHLVISLDHANEEEHNRIRGVACYEDVMNSVKIAKGLGKLPILNFTITRDSIAGLPDMVELSEKLGVLLWINPVYNCSGLQGFEKSSLDYISRYFGRKNVALNLGSLELIKKGGNRVKRPVCRAGEATVTLFPDNTLVSPCFYYQKAKINIKGDLLSKLRGREVKESASFHGRGDVCSGCLAWEYLNPSMLRPVSKEMFLSLYSFWKLFWKELKLKKGVKQ